MTRKLLLIVDDEPVIRRLLHRILSDKFDILEAENGQAAVKLAAENQPDLVLMDIMMPGMDGMTACYHIKGQDTTGKTRVVMLTGINHELNKKVSFSVMRADGYITKPFEKEGLFKTIEDVLAKAPVSDCTPAST